MKLLSRRAALLLAMAALTVLGALFFVIRYDARASAWAAYPANKHLYTNGQLTLAGTIYDRDGTVLAQTADGTRKYAASKAVRTALMQTVGDSGGNVSTGVQTFFGSRLTGWNLLGGTYRFQKKGGNDLKLTLDAQLCVTAYQALAGRKGAVGVYNYKTGEILCMVSSPSFDPENPPDVAADPEKYDGVYLNRLLSSTFTPGSVFKLVTAAAALDTLPDAETRTWHCGGSILIGGNEVTCPKDHGDETLTEALADSCNVTFAQIAGELGADALQKYAEKAGFNAALTVSGIPTAKGTVDLAGADAPALAWAGIGQYTDAANPLNFMAYVGAIGNGGLRVTPRLISNGAFPFSLPEGNTRILSQQTADKLKTLMRNDVIANYGESNYKGLSLCAKSGTAEVGAGKSPNAWFAGFLDREDCPLAFVVVVENGGSGAKAAGPIAAAVLKAAVKGMSAG